MAKKANKTANNHVAAGLTTVTDAVSDVASTGKEKSVPLVNMVRRVVLAGVEAAALTTDEVQDFLNRLVERGGWPKRTRKLMNDVVTRRDGAEKRVEKSVESASNVVEEQIEKILARLNVPNKGDIEELSKKIATLAQKVDDLVKVSQ
ncbi:MAG: phasin family protein [Anaerolineae bacterium]|nr:MAG: phasin family protein [Anaerolineae bacterium]